MKNIVNKLHKMTDHANILLLQINETIGRFCNQILIIQKCLETLNADLSEYIILFTSHMFICVRMCVTFRHTSESSLGRYGRERKKASSGRYGHERKKASSGCYSC